MLVVGEKVVRIEERSVQVFCHRTKSRRSSNTLADSLSDRLWRESMVTMMGMEIASTYDDVEYVDDADVQHEERSKQALNSGAVPELESLKLKNKICLTLSPSRNGQLV